MRKAIAMIELIFAIVVIAISVVTIPTMMAIANNSNKTMVLDDDVMLRLKSETLEIFQSRWDGNYGLDENSSMGRIVNTASGNYECDDDDFKRKNKLTTRLCSDTNLTASAIPNSGSGDVRNGIEQLNGFDQDVIEIVTTDASLGAESIDIDVEYGVSYVSDNFADHDGGKSRKDIVWRLGFSDNLAPSASASTTNLKRVVVNFKNEDLGVDTTLSFFKSNIGVADE